MLRSRSAILLSTVVSLAWLPAACADDTEATIPPPDLGAFDANASTDSSRIDARPDETSAAEAAFPDVQQDTAPPEDAGPDATNDGAEDGSATNGDGEPDGAVEASVDGSTDGDVDASADAADGAGATFTLSVLSTVGGTVGSSPSGIACSAAIGADCSEAYPAGTPVTLAATADANFQLSAWGGDCAQSSAFGNAAIRVDADRTCSASFVGVSGAVAFVTPPPSVVPNVTEDPTNIVFFLEQSAVTLSQPLAFDAHVPDTYVAAPPVGGAVPAGTTVNVYFVHFDPPGTASSVTRNATIVLPDQVIALVTSNATLDATDSQVGGAGIVYPAMGSHPNRGLELNGEDSYTLSSDRRTVSLALKTTSSSDHVRIITTVGGAPSPFTRTSNVSPLSAPASVVTGALESSTTVPLFLERTVTLGAALAVDITTPGVYASTTGLGGVVGSGGNVESWFLHFDPVGGGAAGASYSVSFTRPILGVIVRAATLDASDAVVGSTTTTYPASGAEPTRGVDLAASEAVTFSADGKSVRFSLTATTSTDDARIIVAAP